MAPKSKTLLILSLLLALAFLVPAAARTAKPLTERL